LDRIHADIRQVKKAPAFLRVHLPSYPGVCTFKDGIIREPGSKTDDCKKDGVRSHSSRHISHAARLMEEGVEGVVYVLEVQVYQLFTQFP
jgi:hypothetical protein